MGAPSSAMPDRSDGSDGDARDRPAGERRAPPARTLRRVPDIVALLPPLAERVSVLLDAAEADDGARALSEHAELALRADRLPVEGLVHLGVAVGDALLAYAQVEMPPDGPVTVEAVVHPRHRRGGTGAGLRDAVLARVSGREVRAWAHGDDPGAAALAAGVGARRVRELLQMLRRFDSDPDGPEEPVLPPGVRLRAMRPGADEDAWLAVNARAFSSHPEQGTWTRADLAARMAEPWFDPAGVLLAEDEASGELLGFHWTKVHAATPERPAVGEVYVLGVDPAAQGRRLGGALTLAGLRHLRGLGLDAVLLYVEADNALALRVYRGLGFEVVRVDVQYALP